MRFILIILLFLSFVNVKSQNCDFIKRELQIRKIQVSKQREVINIITSQRDLRNRQYLQIKLQNSYLVQENKTLKEKSKHDFKLFKRKTGFLGGTAGLLLVVAALSFILK